MKFFVGVTDNEWFRSLSGLDAPEEVNFWQPRGPRPFRALAPGDLFLFKLHWPHNYVVGGGTYTYAPPTGLPVSLAWEAFGENNGAPSFERMLERIAKYRDAGRPGRAEYDIGCIILTDPFFFPEDDWIPAPEDFARNFLVIDQETSGSWPSP